MAKRKHWTQTPAGKKIMKASVNAGKWGRRKPSQAPSQASPVKHGKKPVRTEVLELAKVGARVRLAEIDREREKLLIFLDEKTDA